MQKVYIGIDNGISGAVVALSPESQIIDMLPMPIQKARGGNEIDIITVWGFFTQFYTRDQLIVLIEEPGGSKSAKAAKSMAGSFHALRAMCALKNLRWHRITPRSWQSVMLPGCQAGETKPRALELAKRLWPDENFLESKRCRVPNDGLIDAALIAEYGRQKNL